MIEECVSREELQRLVSTFLVAVGAITIFALFAFIVVPGLRNANRPAAVPQVAPPQGETGWLDPTEYPPARGYLLPPVDPNTVLTANPRLLERGTALFKKNCVTCHGESGQGDGPASASLDPPARDFTKPTGWKTGHQLAGIYKTISEGIRGSGMASYDYVAAKDRMALAHYVQSLGAFPRDPDDPAALDALAKQFASAGEKVPNKIPVSMAMQRLEAELTSASPLSAPAGAHEDPGARLFARMVLDPARAARTLALAPGWRQSVQALANTVVPGVPGNGFSVSAATLSRDEWQAFFSELINAIPR